MTSKKIEHLRAARSWADPQSNAAPISADALSDIVYVIDIDEQKNVFVNKAVGMNLGYSEAEIAELGSDLFPALIHPDDLPAVGVHYERLAKMPDGMPLTIEYRCRHNNGHWLWMRSSDAVFERTDDGAPKLIVGSAVDITPLKEREDTIALLNTELAHRVQNLFAICLSMIRLARRSKAPLDETLDDLERRMSVLGRLHSRVRLARDDDPIPLHALIGDFFGEMDVHGQVSLKLTPVEVPARLVTTVSVILYELSSGLLGAGDASNFATLTTGPTDNNEIELRWTQPRTADEIPAFLRDEGQRLLEFAALTMGGSLSSSSDPEHHEVTLRLPKNHTTFRQGVN